MFRCSSFTKRTVCIVVAVALSLAATALFGPSSDAMAVTEPQGSSSLAADQGSGQGSTGLNAVEGDAEEGSFAEALALGEVSTSLSSGDQAELRASTSVDGSDIDKAATVDLSSGTYTVEKGGDYLVPEGVGGTIVVATTDPVSLTGCEIAWENETTIASTPNVGLRVDCSQTPGVNLTLHNLHLQNDDDSNEAPLVSFAGEGNVLSIGGIVVLQQEASSQKGLAAVGIAKGGKLTIAGAGELYVLEGPLGPGISKSNVSIGKDARVFVNGFQLSSSNLCVVTYRNPAGRMVYLELEPDSRLTYGGKTYNITSDHQVPDPDTAPDPGYATVGYVVNRLEGQTLLVESSGSPISYSIVYDAAGGTVPQANPTEFTVESSGIYIADAEREGYVFLGWFDESGVKWESVSKGTTGDVSLTASWGRDLLAAAISGISSSYEYTGQEIVLDLRVVHDGKELVEGIDYSTSFANNTEVGLATVTVSALAKDVIGSWLGSFLITTPTLVDSDSGISASGVGLAAVKRMQQSSGLTVALEVEGLQDSYERDLRSQLAAVGYDFHAGFSAKLVAFASDGGKTPQSEVISAGFGELSITVPVDIEEGKVVAVYLMDGLNAEIADRSRLSVVGGEVTFETDELGTFVIVSRASSDDAISDSGSGEGLAEEEDGGSESGVGLQAESSGSGGSSSSTASKKSAASAAAAKSSAAGTVDDATGDGASGGSGAGGDGAGESGEAAGAAYDCDGCLWCAAGPFADSCDDLCSEGDPCPWCSAAPMASLGVLAGVCVSAWALFMRFRRPKLDADYGF